MPDIEIYFDGYCPESLLKGQQVEMRLNEDDFWESEATGLQISIFPPYAAILRWRGNGTFRSSSNTASNELTGLMLTGAGKEEGSEIFPDEENIIRNKFDLHWYLDEIYKNKEEFEASKFNYSDPALEEQKQYLNTLLKEDFRELFHLYDQLKAGGYNSGFMSSQTFRKMHQALYDLKLIFNFNWKAWGNGWKNINDHNIDCSNCSLLELSMYLTAIFRTDRFSEGTIEQNFINGTLDKIFIELKAKIHC